jgi:hypothetical protein
MNLTEIVIKNFLIKKNIYEKNIKYYYAPDFIVNDIKTMRETE